MNINIINNNNNFALNQNIINTGTDKIQLDSPEACNQTFGVNPGDFIITPRGQKSRVVGAGKRINSPLTDRFLCIQDEHWPIYDLLSKEDFANKKIQILRIRNVEKKDKNNPLEEEEKNFSLTDNIHQYIHQFIGANLGCDKTLIIDDKEVKIHSCLWKSYSKYFKTLFGGKFNDNKQEKIPFDLCSHEDFLLIRDYLYTGQILINQNNILVLFQAAEHLGIDKLVTECKTFFKECLSPSNFLDYYTLLHPSENFPKQILEDFIKTNRMALLSHLESNKDILELSDDVLQDLLHLFYADQVSQEVQDCYRLFKVLPGYRVKGIPDGQKAYTTGTVLGIDENKNLLVHSDLTGTSFTTQKYKVLSKNPHWADKETIKERLKKPTTNVLLKKIKKTPQEKDLNDIYLNRKKSEICSKKTITAQNGTVIEFVNPLQCHQRYGVFPGDIIGTKNGYGFVEGMDIRGHLWIQRDDLKRAVCYDYLASKEWFSRGYNIILQQSSYTELPLSKNKVSIDHSNVAANHFVKLAQQDDGCDVTFNIEGKEIKAHSWVLSSRSKYFENKFAKTTSKKINIKNCSYETFKKLIEYLYDGSITIDSATALPLYKLAHKMQLEELKAHCEDYLKTTNLSVRDFPKYYAYLQTLPAEHPLVKSLPEYIKSKKELLWDHFLNHPEQLARLPVNMTGLFQHFQDRPLALFNLIDAIVRCPKTFLHRPHDVFSLVHFERISLKDLFSKVANKRYFSDEKILEFARKHVEYHYWLFSDTEISAWEHPGLLAENTLAKRTFFSRNGEKLDLNLSSFYSEKIYEKYRVYPGYRIRISREFGPTVGTVIGMDKQEKLWIQLDGHKGAFFIDQPYSKIAQLDIKIVGRKLLLSWDDIPIPNANRISETDLSKLYDTEILSERQKLFANTSYSNDLYFKIGNTKIEASSKLLAHFSPYLEKLIKNSSTLGLEEGKRVISFDECSANEFETLQEYLFTGKVTLHTHNVIGLYNLADKLKLEKLRNQCMSFFENNLAESNLVDYFTHFQPFSSDHPLKKIFIGFIKTNKWILLSYLQDEKNKDSLLNLYLNDSTGHAIQELLGYFCSSSIKLFYVELFIRLDNFVQQHKDRLSDTQIKKLFSGINFEDFSVDELFRIVDKKGYLDDKQMIAWARR